MSAAQGGFGRLEELAQRHRLVYELGGGEPGAASITARRLSSGGTSSRKWLVGQGDDFEAAAGELIRLIEESVA